MTINPDSLLAIFGIVAATFATILGGPFLYRKLTARLTTAQTEKVEAETVQINSATVFRWIDRYNKQSDYMSDLDHTLAEHAAWDWFVMKQSEELGWGVPPPPPLKPPNSVQTRSSIDREEQEERENNV